MRPLLFVVADKNMEYVLRGFFERNGWDRAVPCEPFEFDAARDILVAVGQNDPGLYKRANDLLRPFHGKYERVVVMIDAEWNGSPGAEEIRAEIEAHIVSAGWAAKDGLALVLEPEIDVWLWSNSPHVATAMGWKNWDELRSSLKNNGWLMEAGIKPERPKEAAEWALRQRQKPRSSTLYWKIANVVSVSRCKDPTLNALLNALRRWFPQEEG